MLQLIRKNARLSYTKLGTGIFLGGTEGAGMGTVKRERTHRSSTPETDQVAQPGNRLATKHQNLTTEDKYPYIIKRRI
ncbi:hypothetical protein AN161_04445 [Lysinibacillus sp. FJAT-14222]|nr:hypothetical protein AN161_04445 [Lysinibacillus sp. FJAT-14222]